MSREHPNYLCVTLDLEPDFAGIVEKSYDSCDVSKLTEYFRVLDENDIKLTVYVVGELLDEELPIVEKLKEHGAEFELHSNSHDLADPDGIEEIRRGARAFEKTFGRKPKGYRAPQGRITKAGLENLEDEGFVYDSSVFPSIWPHPRYLLWPRKPYRVDGMKLVEVPFATFPFIRLTISISWIKLLGWRVFDVLMSVLRTPKVCVLDSHLHDFYSSEESFNRLSPIWRRIYGLNRDKGVEFFERYVKRMKKKGYESIYVSEYVDSFNG